VTRVLEAQGHIVGKGVCENLCHSGTSHSAATGPVDNPRAKGYSAGGSSSGCGVLVSLGEVDMAIGADQGGSVRIPACNCGIVGFKVRMRMRNS
jgi:amidase